MESKNKTLLVVDNIEKEMSALSNDMYLKQNMRKPTKLLTRENKNIVAGIVVNSLEWYDFAIYGFFAPILAKLFFPSDNYLISLMSVFGVFAVGFLMRPVGALLFGHIGDKIGRKSALILTICMMAIPTASIGLLPTYQQIGIAAPILLVILRLFQGISIGGGLPGSVSFVIENAPSDRRGFYGSLTGFSAAGGILLGSAIVALTAQLISQAQLNSWGWRLPFLLGMGVGILSLYIMKDANESSNFEAIKLTNKTCKAPVVECIRKYWKEVLTVMGAVWINASSFYMGFVYIATYISTETHRPMSVALYINTLCMIVLAFLIPLMGHISDKIGRKPVLITCSVGFILLSIPMFLLIHQNNLMYLIIAQLIFSVLVAIPEGVIPVFMVEKFPTEVRMSGMAMGYSLAFGLFGGTTPLIATFLIKYTGLSYAPAFWLIVSAVISLFVYLNAKETYKDTIS